MYLGQTRKEEFSSSEQPRIYHPPMIDPVAANPTLIASEAIERAGNIFVPEVISIQEMN